MDAVTAQLCIVGGGPAGMMAGLLFARAGVDVVVLEKHADFLRDFRGDTVHPSTLELFHELGLLDDLLALPHSRLHSGGFHYGDDYFELIDFARLDATSPFIAMMPQWDLLDFIADAARRYPGFRLLMETEATGLVEEGGRVLGIEATGPDGAFEIRADLSLICSGRNSLLTRRAGFETLDYGAPMDVLWFRVPKRGSSGSLNAHILPGRMIIPIDRGDYFQAAYAIPKGTGDQIRAGDIAQFRARTAADAPELAEGISAVRSWDDVKLLSVQVDRLMTWSKPGLLAIGDAAHAMSPIGGVGINLAVQDAVAAANILAGPMARGEDVDPLLPKVQARREFPVKVTQRLQLGVQNAIIAPALSGELPDGPKRIFRLIERFPALKRLPARAIGLGIRPEHVRSPEAPPRPAL